MILRAMAKDPENRHRNAIELLDEAEALIAKRALDPVPWFTRTAPPLDYAVCDPGLVNGQY